MKNVQTETTATTSTKTTTSAMEVEIKKLVGVVKAAETTTSAAQEISRLYKTISPKSALSVLKDVCDYMNGDLTKDELSMYLITAGI